MAFLRKLPTNGKRSPLAIEPEIRSDKRVKFWERPAVRLFSVFLLLGGFAWWIFQTVSLPPTLRDLWNEDQAIAEAATPPSEEEYWQAEWAKLPAPPEEHAPEVAALLQRLQKLPPIPQTLRTALKRDVAAPPTETPPPWSDEEKKMLLDTQEAYLQAWAPFLAGPSPDWKRFPDSIALLRSSEGPLWKDEGAILDLLGHVPGLREDQPTLEAATFHLSYARQTRNLGTIRFGSLSSWTLSDTVNTALSVVRALERGVILERIAPDTLRDLPFLIPPAPSIQDLREGLEADRSLFLRTSSYLESLPSSTSAKAGLTRWLRDESDASWYLQEAEQPATARDLAALLRRDAALLDTLQQKTYLSAPAWRQWLQGIPGTGLPPMLSKGLGGFKDFENVRTLFLITRAVVEVKIALEQGGVEAARTVPDPSRPGSFFLAEPVPSGVRVSSSYIPAGKNEALSWIIPSPSRETP